MPCHALLVEPDVERRSLLSATLSTVAIVWAPDDFLTAKRLLSTTRYDLVVANIRLEAYSGLHLVYLVGEGHTRSVVYADHDDLYLARTTQAAGAFYERGARIAGALPSYVSADLPPRDRRDPAVVDRRSAVMFRGGRRSADVALLA
jgi:hypothetical protein